MSSSKAKLEFHGLTGTPLHLRWGAMKNRCYSKKSPKYKDYGARGITVCKQWRESFICFHDWAIANGYKAGLSLDRKHNDKNYCPSNCRWVSRTKQQRNTRVSKIWTLDGVEYLSINEAADALGLTDVTVMRRCNGYKLRGKFYPPRPGCSSRLKYSEEEE